MGFYPDQVLALPADGLAEQSGEALFQLKNDAAYLLPLSHQAVTILRELQPLTGKQSHVFHSARSRTRHMSENANVTLNGAACQRTMEHLVLPILLLKLSPLSEDSSGKRQ
jgi:hypothetical protein